MAKTKKFIKPLYDTTIKYLVKSTDTRYIIYKLIYLATGIDLSDYTLIDQELNTGNNIRLRKKILNTEERKKFDAKKKK